MRVTRAVVVLGLSLVMVASMVSPLPAAGVAQPAPPSDQGVPLSDSGPPAVSEQEPDPSADLDAHARDRLQRSSAGDLVEGQVIVGFRPGTTRAKRAEARAANALTPVDLSGLVDDAELVQVPDGKDVDKVVRALERNPNVLYAEPNGVVSSNAPQTPNDPRFGEQWGLHNTGQSVGGVAGTIDADIDAPEAWARTTGSSSVVVAVVDSGIATDHPEFAGRLWSNPGEQFDGLDSDGNGLVDDVRGWDWTTCTTLTLGCGDNDPFDGEGHGTHVAGIIGARGNNAAGITGVAWNVRLMPLRVLDRLGAGSHWAVGQAFAYAGAKGAHIVNASFGGPVRSSFVTNAIKASPQTLFVVAAGNDGINNDTAPQYPCNTPEPNVVCVAASDQHDALADFGDGYASNFGAASVHLAAPGKNVISTYPRALTVYFDDIQSNPAGWVTGGTHPWGLLGDGTGNLWLSDSPIGNYANNTDSWVWTANDIVVPPHAAECRAEYLLRLDTEFGFDFLRIWAWSAATEWVQVESYSGSTGGQWFHDSLSLAGVDGQSGIKLGFQLVTDSTITADGAHIDDVSVVCTSRDGTYGVDDFTLEQGTSMAAPFVTGAAAVLKAAKPAATVAELRAALLEGVDKKSTLTGKLSTGGRLNVNRSMTLISRPAAVKAAPAFGTLTAGTPKPGATMSWRNASTTDLSGIEVRWNDGSGWRTKTVPPGTHTLLSGLTQGKNHSFAARALHGSGFTSAWTASVKLNGTTLSSAVSPKSVTSGSSTTVSGTLKRTGGSTLSGRKVQVQIRTSRPDGTWTGWSNVGSPVNTSSTGVYRLVHKTPRNARYRAVFAGSGSDLGSVGPARSVTVAPRVTATLSTTSMKLGATAKLTGTVSPSLAGKKVYLQQRRSDGTWRDTGATAKLSSTSKYTFSIKPAKRGTYVYRVRIPAYVPYVKGLSPARTLKVQ